MRWIWPLLSPLFLFATFIGNPGQPALQTEGVISQPHRSWSFRLGYFGDYTYSEKFLDEFRLPGCTRERSQLQVWSQMGMLVFNARERLDLYVLAGGTRIQIDSQVQTPQNFSWGGGGKLLIIEEGAWRLGLDVKYFTSEQIPAYFLCENLPYNRASNFSFHYREIQTAMGISYCWKTLSPYLQASYLLAKLRPDPLMVLLRLPDEDFLVDAPVQPAINARRWGLAAGITLIAKKTASLGVEWRGFAQNGLSVAGQLRF